MQASGETPLGDPLADNEELISLQEAARSLDLHYATVYRYLRLGRLPAIWSGGRWLVDPRDLTTVAREPSPGAAPRRGRPRAATYRQRLLERLLAADEPGAWAVVESALVAGSGPRWVLLEVLAPALREIGDGWGSGRLTVADEHRATAVAIRIVARLGPLFARRGRPRGRVLLAGAPGDPHSLPSAMLADVLRGERFAVTDLGADTPPEDLAAVVAQTQPLLAVGISVSTRDNLAGVQKSLEAVRSVAPDVPTLVGGPAIGDEEIARAYGADGWAPDGLATAKYLERFVPSVRSRRATERR